MALKMNKEYDQPEVAVSTKAALLRDLLPALLCTLALALLPVMAKAEHSAESRSGHDTTSLKALTETQKQDLLHLLKQDCGSCHGMTLQGGLGPALTRDALAQRSVDELAFTITHGREALAMPPWKSILSPLEIRWLAEQLKRGL